MKKVLLSILAFVGLMTVATTVNAEEKSSYFEDVTCQIGSIEDFSCSITSKDNFVPSSKSKVYLYMVPNGEDVSTVRPFEFNSSFIQTDGNTINIVADRCFFKYGFAEASFDFVIELVNADGNGEKIYYTANTSTLTKIETIGTKVEENKKDEATDSEENTDSEKEEEKHDETILIPENNTVDSTKFEEVKNNGTKLTVESKKDNKVQYAWIFDGSKMESANFNIDLSLNIGSSANKKDIESLFKNKAESLVLNFAHHGDLPDGTIVRVNVADKYANGDKLKLYYYDETAKELKEEVTEIEVKDGYVQFNLQHCSDYVLEKITQTTTADNKVVSNNAQTSSMNTIIYGALSFVSLVGIAYLVFRKKKEVA